MKNFLRLCLVTTVASVSLASVALAASPTTANAAAPGSLGDGNGDGIGDVWATVANDRYSHADIDGTTTAYKGLVTQFKAGPAIGMTQSIGATSMGLGDASQVVALPDMTGDKRADALARVGDQLYLYKNDGNGALSRSTQVGHGWGAFDNIIYAGHLNGDADQYLLARRTTDASLFAYKFTSGGALTDMGKVGQNWGAIRFMLAPGQITGDAKDDLMAIDTAGNLDCYRSTGLGKLSDAGVCGRGWGGFKYAFIAGDMDNDGSLDLVGVKATTHPGTSCDSDGNCDPIEPLCTSEPNTVLDGKYATEYEQAASNDQCTKQGKTYRLKPEFRGPMYVYQNLGNATWGSARRLGYDMWLYHSFA